MRNTLGTEKGGRVSVPKGWREGVRVRVGMGGGGSGSLPDPVPVV